MKMKKIGPRGGTRPKFYYVDPPLISLHIRSMWETICDAQAGFCTLTSNSKYLTKFSRTPLFWNWLQNTPPPKMKTSDLSWPKFTPEYPPWKWRLQIWVDQSSLQNTPPKVKTSDLSWPKFTPEYPPQNEDFRFELTKVHSRITPPCKMKTSDLSWPKFTPEYPPENEDFRFELTEVHSRIPPPESEDFRFELTKVHSRITPPPWKWRLQIWVDQSSLQNTPPENKDFRFQLTKVHSRIPHPSFWCWWEFPYVETYIYHTDNTLVRNSKARFCWVMSEEVYQDNSSSWKMEDLNDITGLIDFFLMRVHHRSFRRIRIVQYCSDSMYKMFSKPNCCGF